MNGKTFPITREKHMDHLVKVVPLIVLGYALQCYVLGSYHHLIGTSTITFLGLSLVAMIGAFIIYDVKYQALLDEDHLSLSFFSFHRKIPLSEIFFVQTIDAEESFGSVIFHTKKHGKIRLYFVDDATKIKEWIDLTNNTGQLAA